MIAKFNRRLRVVMLAVGALFLILKLSVGSAEDEKKSAKRDVYKRQGSIMMGGAE